MQAQVKRWKPTKVNGHEDHLLDGHWIDLPSQQRGCAEIPSDWCLRRRPADAGLLLFALVLVWRVPLMARVVDGRRLTTAGRSTTAGIRPRRMPTVAVIWRHEISATDISATDSAGRWIAAFAAAFPCRDPGIHGGAAFAWWRRLRWRRPLRARRSGAPSARWSATALLRTRRCGRRG